LDDLAEAMASDARFIDVRGFASEEVHSGIPGALRPIEP
jgi:post-segregation antitoxin (ccd killing protein)